MLDRKKILNELKEEIKILEEQIKQDKIFKKKSYIISTVIEKKKVINRILTILLASIIVSKSTPSSNRPFLIDNKKEAPKLELMLTSNGLQKTTSSFDYTYYTEYDDKILQHTTAWKINKNGLYERVVTTYEINNEEDLFNSEKIFSMSKEEIGNLYQISNIETIQKNKLTNEEKIYFEDCLIIKTILDDEKNAIIREETIGENILSTTGYIFLIAFDAFILGLVRKKTIEKTIDAKLNQLYDKYKILSEDEIDKLKKILEVKKENLMLLDNNYESFNSNSNENGHCKIKRIQGDRCEK